MSALKKTMVHTIELTGFCESCQATSDLGIVIDSIACKRCGSPLAVSKDVQSSISALRTKLLQIPVEKTQLLAQTKGGYGPKLNGIASAIPWIIAGCWPQFLPVFAQEDITTIIPGVALTTQIEKLIWWTLYVPITGFTFNYYLDRLSDRISANVAEFCQPIKASDKQMRCRVCYAALPEGGHVRRCIHCMSDNLIHSKTLEKTTLPSAPLVTYDALPAVRQQELLADRIARTSGYLPWTYLLLSPFPLLLLNYAPGISLPVSPICWLLPAFLLIIGIYFAVSSKNAEPIQRGGLVIPTPGDTFNLDDGNWKVRYSIVAPKPLVGGWGKQGHQAILLISKIGRHQPTHALLVNWSHGRSLECIRYQLNTVAKIQQDTTEEWDHSVIVHLFSTPTEGLRESSMFAKLNWHLEGTRMMQGDNSRQEIEVPEQLWLSIAESKKDLERELTLERPEFLTNGIRR